MALTYARNALRLAGWLVASAPHGRGCAPTTGLPLPASRCVSRWLAVGLSQPFYGARGRAFPKPHRGCSSALRRTRPPYARGLLRARSQCSRWTLGRVHDHRPCVGTRTRGLPRFRSKVGLQPSGRAVAYPLSPGWTPGFLHPCLGTPSVIPRRRWGAF